MRYSLFLTMIYYLNIGTNLGDRRANIAAAVAALEQRTMGSLRVSDAVETPAWGFSSPNDFLNVGISLKSHIRPLDMLAILKDIERTMGSNVHRDAAGNYADRIIDLDIVAIDEMVVDEPTLQVPHRHLVRREFFLRPLAQLAPHWMHPTLHKTASQLLATLHATQA